MALGLPSKYIQNLTPDLLQPLSGPSPSPFLPPLLRRILTSFPAPSLASLFPLHHLVSTWPSGATPWKCKLGSVTLQLNTLLRADAKVLIEGLQGLWTGP